ncbi:hypothetical protein O1L55_05750, partial [Streptomyces albulus]|nr:hypothetical protein [Streptomyces noursei]
VASFGSDGCLTSVRCGGLCFRIYRENFPRFRAPLHPVTTRRQLAGLDPYAAGAAVAAFQEQLVALDAWSLDDPDNWWSLVTEQMWHGLF